MTFKVWSEILTSRENLQGGYRKWSTRNHQHDEKPFHQHFDSFWTTPSICIPYRHLRQKPSSGFFRTLRPPQKMQKTPGITPACSSRPQAEQPPSRRELPIQWQCTLPSTSLVSRWFSVIFLAEGSSPGILGFSLGWDCQRITFGQSAPICC